MKKKSRSSKKKNRTKTQKIFRKILLAILITGSVGIATMGIFVGLVSFGYFGELPTQEDLANIKNNLATEIFSADNKLLGRYFIQQRTPTAYENISPSVIKALIATEDVRFYEHEGIDYQSLVRVLLRTIILQDRSGGGGSTISQQLAKNLFPRTSQDNFYLFTRKIKEALMAKRLERAYSKKEILTLYLNTVPFGEDIYGIELAAKRFFNKPAKKLELEEAAVLVGMLKANYTYNPRLFPEKSKSRRNVVLSQMNKYGYLSADSLTQFSKKPLVIDYHRISTSKGLATYFREQLKTKVQAWCDANTKPDGTHYNLYTDGLKIYTTLDSKLQEHAENAVKTHLKSLQQTFTNHWGNVPPWQHDPRILDRAIKTSTHYKGLMQKGLSHDEAISTMNQRYPMTVFSWEGSMEKDMSPIDSIKHYLRFLHAGVVAVNPKNGAVKAWVGGIDHEFFKYDHAKTSTRRQVGSTFKPFVYAAALENGADPCDYVSGKRTTYTNLANWTPDNADTTENKRKYSFEGALAHSVNTVSVKTLELAGIERTIELAKAAGITAELPEVPSIALGTADISLIEMAAAYSAFANEGQRVDPYFISRIEDKNGTVLYEAKPKLNGMAMRPKTARMINHMLKAVVNKGTAGRLRWKYGLPNELAGKTGTTQSNADGWFIGYNPELVMAVWVGADNPGIRFRSTALGSGANMALPIFGLTFQQLNKDPTLSYISNSRFPLLSVDLRDKLNCDPFKEDKNFFERLLKVDLTRKEEVKAFDEKRAEETKEKKGFFKKIGDIFKKKEN